jgi:signal peptidase II
VTRAHPGGRRWAALLGLAALAVAVDQVTKALARDRLTDGDTDIAGPIRLHLTHNEGVAFGLFGGNAGTIVAVTLLAVVAIAAWLWWADPTTAPAVGGALVAGGAAGNLIDRLRLDAVTDFIDVGPWPTFNVADSAIVVGVALIVASGLREPAGRGDVTHERA